MEDAVAQLMELSKDELAAAVLELQQQIEEKETELTEFEHALRDATESLRTFREEQVELQERLADLQEKYGTTRGALKEVLWEHLAADPSLGGNIPPPTDVAESHTGVGRYRFDGKIGKGRFSAVYSACMGGEARPSVAVKVIQRDTISSVDELRRLNNELAALRSMSHECVVSLRDLVVTERAFYVVTPLGGPDLFALAEESGGEGIMPRDAAYKVLRQLLAAIQHMHNRGFAHLDIKPSVPAHAARRRRP